MPIVGRKIETTSDNFGGMVRDGCLLVDKTLMIKEFFEGQKVSLITRPRRFGKTINMSMLQHFFASEVEGQPTVGLFDAFSISREDSGHWIEHQGQYPVIFISFKDVKESSYGRTVEKIRDLIKKLYREHVVLLELVTEGIYKDLFNQYLNGSTNDESLETAISFLSEFIFKATRKKTIILIDEYDTPLTHAYQNNFLNEISSFLRNMFSASLKSNGYLEKGLMTGILRVSKNELLSGLNNLQVYTLLDDEYSRYFGFREDEVTELTTHLTITESLEEIKLFYNGYVMGIEQVIYNPWSLMSYFNRKRLVPYWVLTSGDGLLKKLFLETSSNIKEQLAHLMQGELVVGKISLKTSYEELMESPEALWTLLLFSGYLTVTKKTFTMNHVTCQLRIPNNEILSQYEEIFNTWLNQNMGETRYQTFMTSLLSGDVLKFTESLGEYLLDALSFRDVVGDKQAENFYHGFVAALIASVRETHWVDSKKESGRGLYDVLLIPKTGHGDLGIILEFKHVKRSQSLEEATKTALSQIDESDYAKVLERSSHVTRVLEIGLAFSGKEARSIYRETDMLTRTHGNLYQIKRYDDEDFSGDEIIEDEAKLDHDEIQQKKKSKSSLQQCGLLGQQSSSSSSAANAFSCSSIQEISKSHK